MPRPIDLEIALFASSLLGALPLSCTVFDDVLPTTGYFDAQGAARICARMMACPTLAPSLRASFGVPADDASFSACVDWMAGPVPATSAMISAARKALTTIADAPSCEAALSSVYVETLPEGDTRCDGGADACVGDDVLDCHARAVVRCQSPLFRAGARCQQSGSVARCSAESFEGPSPPPRCEESTLVGFDAPTSTVQRVQCDALGLACVPVRVGPGHLVEAAVCASSVDGDNICADGASPSMCTNVASVVFCNRRDEVEISLNPSTSFPLRFSLLQSIYTCPDTAPCVPAATGEGTSLAHCRAHTSACTAQDAKALSCDGTSVTVCLDGRLHTIDCAEGGLACRDSAAVGAHCAFPGDPPR